MLNNLKNNELWRNIGIVVVGGLVLLSWWLGFFQIVFYLLGLYAAVFIVSSLFKTTGIINFLLVAGGFILYAASALIGLYLFYVVLSIMFTESFFYGLLLLFLLSIFGGLLYFIPMAIGLVLGYPLIWMLDTITAAIEKPEYTVLPKTEDDLAEIQNE